MLSGLSLVGKRVTGKKCTDNCDLKRESIHYCCLHTSVAGRLSIFRLFRPAWPAVLHLLLLYIPHQVFFKESTIDSRHSVRRLLPAPTAADDTSRRGGELLTDVKRFLTVYLADKHGYYSGGAV